MPDHQAVLNKLRYKPELRAIVLNAPEVYQPVVEAMRVEERLDGEFDFVHAFVTRRDEVLRDGPGWRNALKPNGILWVSYPKGKAIPTDLNRDSLYRAMLEVGLQAVSQVALDEVWSALRARSA
jgi:hypothetical protein